MTKAQFIKQNNGKLFKRIVTKGLTIEDIDQMRVELTALAEQNGATLVETAGAFSLKEYGNVWLKPRVEREKVATLFFKSNATEFDGGRGELPLASEIDGDAFTKDYGTIAYRYELVK